MPIPPILDVFVVWHPDDEGGVEIYEALQEHFHSPAFSGLVGGAVEVYARSAAWSADGAPRSLGITTELAPAVPRAQFNAIVPVIGLQLTRAASDDGWARYLAEITTAALDSAVGVYPITLPGQTAGESVMRALSSFQFLPAAAHDSSARLGRELSQAISQHIRRGKEAATRLSVFISHTKHHSRGEPDAPEELYDRVRARIAGTHLDTFFDAHDIQAGDNWERTLVENASDNALLVVRTDRYAERDWTQREVKLAKENEMPVVTMYALQHGEERGSFLMDHVPTVVCDPAGPNAGIDAALDALVSEALKADLWQHQRSYIESQGFDWLPTRSPEPATLAPWLAGHKRAHADDASIWILHPDPPLGAAEREVIVQMCELAGFTSDVQVLTPRTFATLGGAVHD